MPRPAPLPTAHAADRVFYGLAASILRGELAVGEVLPPERVVAARFGVSRIIARQARHRLVDLGLVQVRQGGRAVVLDPMRATDLRVIDLIYRLGPRTPIDVLEFTERQLLGCELLLRLLARHGTRAEIEEIAALIDEYCDAGCEPAELSIFEERFWTKVAEAGRNRLCILEVSWWFKLAAEEPRVRHPLLAPKEARRTAFLEMKRRLLAGEDVSALYIKMVEPVLDCLQASIAPAAQTPIRRRTAKPRRKR